MSHRPRLGKSKSAELLRTKRDALRDKAAADLKRIWKAMVRKSARKGLA